MDRTGIVVENNGQFSKVKLLRHTACGNCGACQLGDDQKDINLIAKNDVHAEIGDMVEVTMGTGGVLSAAFIMYMIPLFGLFVGILAGQPLFNSLDLGISAETGSALLGVLLMASIFLIIKRFDKRFLDSDKYTAHVQTILQKSHATLEPISFTIQ